MGNGDGVRVNLIKTKLDGNWGPIIAKLYPWYKNGSVCFMYWYAYYIPVVKFDQLHYSYKEQNMSTWSKIDLECVYVFYKTGRLQIHIFRGIDLTFVNIGNRFRGNISVLYLNLYSLL